MTAHLRRRIKPRHRIQVRVGDHVLGTIDRVLRAEMIGNFNPIFCTYHGKEHLVHSEAGDLSDPFRRDNTYAETLFIKI